MAKVGHALGSKQWDALSATVCSALVVALLTGAACAICLYAIRSPLLDAISLPATARGEAEAFWPYAVLRLPPLLLLKSASSVLVGYQRLRLASAINTTLALADSAAFYVVLYSLRKSLPAAGAAVVCTCTAAAFAALATVLACPPEASGGKVRVCSFSRSQGAGLLSLAKDSLNVLLRSLLLSGSCV